MILRLLGRHSGWLRSGLLGWTVTVCLASGTAQGQPLPMDRAAVLAMLCSEGGQDVPKAVRVLLSGVATSPSEERAWAGRIVQAFSAKELRCAPNGAAFLANGMNAATLAPAALPDGLHAPLPSMRSRGLLEQVGAALALFTADRPEARIAAVRTLERRADGLPPDLLPTALMQEKDTGVQEALRSLMVAAGLHAPDPAQRIAAIEGLGRDCACQALGAGRRRVVAAV